MLAWAEGTEGDGEVRIALARERDRIVGVLPLIGRGPQPGAGARYELLGSGIGYRIEPLAEPGARDAVAAAGGELLEGLDPALGVLALHGVDCGAGWGERLAGSYPGGARLERESRLHASVLEFGDAAGYGEWLQNKSRHFRKHAGRDRRRFQRVGELRIASTPAELERAVTAFPDLHLGRFADRGRSNLDYPRMAAQLKAAGERLGPDRLRAAMAIVDDEVISVDFFVRAGDTAASWNGGWRADHGDLRPGSVTLMAAIEDAIESGVRTIDLGPGAHPWKERFATRTAPVVSESVVPRA
jgi:hypothetical protein